MILSLLGLFFRKGVIIMAINVAIGITIFLFIAVIVVGILLAIRFGDNCEDGLSALMVVIALVFVIGLIIYLCTVFHPDTKALKKEFIPYNYNIVQMADDYNAKEKTVYEDDSTQERQVLVRRRYLWLEDWTLYTYKPKYEKYEIEH